MKEDCKGKFAALVLAGGRGQRMNSTCPKSLLRVSGVPLVRYTINGLFEAGISPVLVVTDRCEWIAETKSIFSNIRDVTVKLSSEAQSTLLVAIEAANLLANKFFFVYGHAPRPASLYREMLVQRGRIIVTQTRLSSKRKRISSNISGYIEPPYLLERHSLSRSTGLDWASFISEHCADLSEVPLAGPSEFNYDEEYKIYRRYIRSQWRCPPEKTLVTSFGLAGSFAGARHIFKGC